MRTPREAIHELAQRAALAPTLSASVYRKYGAPGEFVEGQPEEVRALLRGLRSDDAADVAPHVIAWMCFKEPEP